MIKHIVMWKLKESMEGMEKAEIALKMKADLESLISEISQIRKIEIGINILDSQQAYDVVIYSEFDNMQDLNIYQEHPAHLKVAEFVGKVRESRAVVDYEI